MSSKERRCKTCGIGVDKGKQYCAACLPNRHVVRVCKQCGLDITGSRRHLYCGDCACIIKRERKRKQVKIYRAQKAVIRKVKPCKTCGKEIPSYQHAPMRCDGCLPVRKKRASVRKAHFCIVCGVDISERYRAKYCDECRREKENQYAATYSKKARQNKSSTYVENKRVARVVRRGRKKGTFSSLTAKQWSRILDDHNGKCVYCGEFLAVPEREHFLPLALGGETTQANILPSCKQCNTKKSSKHPLDWLVTRPHGLVRFAELSSYLDSK